MRKKTFLLYFFFFCKKKQKVTEEEIKKFLIPLQSASSQSSVVYTIFHIPSDSPQKSS